MEKYGGALLLLKSKGTSSTIRHSSKPLHTILFSLVYPTPESQFHIPHTHCWIDSSIVRKRWGGGTGNGNEKTSGIVGIGCWIGLELGLEGSYTPGQGLETLLWHGCIILYGSLLKNVL